MDHGLVSIITPAFKAKNYIAETIASVRAQTYSNWELLIVDDCSPDETAAVAEAAAMGDPRIRVLRQEQNGGPAAARNGALEVARGRWTAFLDSDDVWLPEKLARQIAFQSACGAKITFTGFRRVDSEGRNPGRFVKVPDRLDYWGLLGNTAIATSTVIIDRSQVPTIRMRKVYYDDFVCWLEILRSGGFARGLNEDLMRYRVLGGSVSRNKSKSAREVWRIYRKVLGLSSLDAGYYFAQYAFNGLRKYYQF